MNNIGIYMITDNLTTRVYIGQSADLFRRYNDHFIRHTSKQIIDQAIRKRPSDFSWSILEYCSEEQLDEREQYWIQYYNSYEEGYNYTKGGQSWRGEYHPKAKITKEESNQIKALLKKGYSVKKIQEIIPNATMGMISSINNGYSWHEEGLTYPISRLNGLVKVTPSLAKEIKEFALSNEVTIKTLSEKFALSTATIGNILHGKIYPNILPDFIVPTNKRKKSYTFSEEEGIRCKELFFCCLLPIREIYNRSYQEKCSYESLKKMITGKSCSLFSSMYNKENRERLDAWNKSIKKEYTLFLKAYNPSLSLKQIGSLLGCSERTIYRILNNEEKEQK